MLFFKDESVFFLERPPWPGAMFVRFAEENNCVVSPFTVKESDSGVNFLAGECKIRNARICAATMITCVNTKNETPHSHIQQYTNIHGPRACKYLTYLQMWSVRSPSAALRALWLSLLCASRYITACTNYNIMFISSRKVHTLKSEQQGKNRLQKKSETCAQTKTRQKNG